VEADHHIYELDGRKLFPINHGKCANLLQVNFSTHTEFYYMVSYQKDQSESSDPFCPSFIVNVYTKYQIFYSIQGSAKVIKQFMERDPENLNFTVVALAPTIK
jgi:hypothetical protein